MGSNFRRKFTTPFWGDGHLVRLSNVSITVQYLNALIFSSFNVIFSSLDRFFALGVAWTL